MFKIESKPKAQNAAEIYGETYRFTVLTSCMIRMEFDENGVFEDRATQCVLNREFPLPPFQVKKTGTELHIITEKLHLTYCGGVFSKNSLNVRVLGNVNNLMNVWYYGEPIDDLGGTARTLDGKNGSCDLQSGIMSKNGFSILDDSKSLLLLENGWVAPRKNKGLDIYFFGYGREYKECLKDFYRLSGQTPMLPRYALGNWWSRYYKYTEKTYVELMDKFKEEEIPFSVAVLDMDWHLVDIDPAIGSGWTGYTWNRELFPDPSGFLKQLHDRNLKVTLNIHPADGIRCHEERYTDMVRELGEGTEEGETVEFDITNPRFLEAYFKVLHEPLEEEGVDFWWIDWQSGSTTKIAGLDPLWMLNHFHYLHNCRNGRRGLCFSRYAGPGSHRYPIGFSGDTVITWESLDFQPYFTATAANIGYTWWSHDIGGHMMGYMDHELAVRWIQFGVFSPINRLHSSSNPFMAKEPWNYPAEKAEIMKRYLQFRHMLVPYLFTMNELCHSQGVPLVKPLYYEHSWEEAAYQYGNEYYFGTQLLVCPVTVPIEKSVLRARTQMWIPEGIWFDLSTGRVYQGNRHMVLWRRLEEMPVFAKAGAIIPLSKDWKEDINQNPEELVVLIFPGSDGKFSLYEEFDGVGVWSDFMMFWEKGTVIVRIRENRLKRKYQFVFPCWKVTDEPEIRVNGCKIVPEMETDGNMVKLKISSNAEIADITIDWKETPGMSVNDYRQEIFDFLREAQISFTQKEQIYSLIERYGKNPLILQELSALHLEKEVYEVVCELLWMCG